MKRTLEKARETVKKPKEVVSKTVKHPNNGHTVNYPTVPTSSSHDMYDSTDDEDDAALTSQQKKELCKEFEKHDWISVWKINRSGIEVHVDKTTTVKDASDALSRIFALLKLSKEVEQNYKLLQVESAGFKFTTQIPKPGDQITAEHPNGLINRIVSVGPYLKVRSKGYHILSAGHREINIDWTCFISPTESDELPSELGHPHLCIFHTNPKLCDIMLIRVTDGLTKEHQEKARNIMYRENGTLELQMPEGTFADLVGKKCIKFTSERQVMEGIVENLEFYSKGLERDAIAVKKAIAVVNATSKENAFSGEGESGMLVAIVPEEGNKATALGIISGIHEETIGGRTHYRTLLTPIWRAWRELQHDAYCHGHHLVLM